MGGRPIWGVHTLTLIISWSKSLLGTEGPKKLEKFAILTRKPWSHVRILIYRTWPIGQFVIVKTQIEVSFSCVCPVIDNGTATLTMLRRNSWLKSRSLLRIIVRVSCHVQVPNCFANYFYFAVGGLMPGTFRSTRLNLTIHLAAYSKASMRYTLHSW